jgi:hypothetical protein
MEIKVSKVLKDFDGNPLLHPESKEPWTVGLVLFTMALGAPPPGTSYTEAEQKDRFKTARDIHAALAEKRLVEISLEMLVTLKADIIRSFGPIVVGQIMPLIGG